MRESIYEKMTNAEKEVADLLKEMGIKWSYEHPVFVWDENERPRVWAPDFYLIPFGIYVEVCGSKDFDYEYRRRIFDKNGHKVIFLHLYKCKKKWLFHFINNLQNLIHSRYYLMNNIFQRSDSYQIKFNQDRSIHPAIDAPSSINTIPVGKPHTL